MEEGSYSANGVKHCIRPCDMTGKSSAVILRQMHPNVVSEATKYDRFVDLPMWMSSLSLEDNSIPYYQQKENECKELERLTSNGALPTDKMAKRTRGSKENEAEPEVSDLIGGLISNIETKQQKELDLCCNFNDKFKKKPPSDKIDGVKPASVVKGPFLVERVQRAPK